MGTKTIVGLVLLVAGAIALYFGLQAADSPLEHARETFTGNYSDDTMLQLIGGAAAIVAGLGLLVAGRRR